ncbi:MAG TPA: 5-oxoprolinase subunit PxpB [Chitinophagaceae bacterium]|nr:5-oxoprolinase subunit PxpB [Chitinophagaceae bacterium]HPN59964.1 5-oxoprolinase subunit PxpB [Chitinophagaceae bacterium]
MMGYVRVTKKHIIFNNTPMTTPTLSYQLFPLGDSALTLDWGNRIDEAINLEVMARYQQFRHQQFPGFIEAVPAYSSLTVYYDPVFIRKLLPAEGTAFNYVRERITEIMAVELTYKETNSRMVRIPVCYDASLSPDLEHILEENKITVEELISLHTGRIYRVYMMGFLPGFAYMGEVDEQLAMARKLRPKSTKAGSVGIAGRQTGIYPFTSPGGWQIIGMTPIELFNRNRKEPTLLQAGDRVQFYSIDKYEFAHY